MSYRIVSYRIVSYELENRNIEYTLQLSVLQGGSNQDFLVVPQRHPSHAAITDLTFRIPDPIPS